ncbi:3,4-dihydroxy-2-butanone-4-phosphate synthase [Roseiterribacter gracilis]|uniref:3,4-dihydroxy-2-butanone 4-phosphate synthase n=1 Tax=Roseiterribacter gracilis TaxID=2812848 RepID=A0A8S8X6B1_9PROT|nr:3,4-dihydroxy-2-butanone-4-phosphate synthase [Rhodospirillales bacterium TMPK1]
MALTRYDPKHLADRDDLNAISSTEEIIEEARNGRMFILIDDEDRENEGDLVIPAQMATPAAINFMAKHGRGLICLALDRDRIDSLGLPLVARRHSSRLETAFTVSIEAREGVTTGISAADRARTIQVAIDPHSGPAEIVTPGHVFPLAAREGGTLVRAGHTEAAVDISRLAGLNPSGVICEIMNDDGSMARFADLVQFSQLHGLKIGTIADLIAHRRRTEQLIERVVESDFTSEYGGDWKMVVYANKVSYAEHVALVKGEIKGDTPTLVRMHAVNLLDDFLGGAGPKSHTLHNAMRQIAAAGSGVVVALREASPTGLSERLKARAEGKRETELREVGVGAQILLDLGVREMVLLSNTPKTIVGLDGYGLTVVEQRPIVAE